MSRLRFYSLSLFYLSSIQQGIQSGHALGELVVKYQFDLRDDPSRQPERNILKDFLIADKTWVVLNGGIAQDISSFLLFLQDNVRLFEYKVPFTPFYEDEESLSGIMTCVGLILPEEYFDAIKYKDTIHMSDCGVNNPDDYVWESSTPGQGRIWTMGTPDWELINRVKSCSLAR